MKRKLLLLDLALVALICGAGWRLWRNWVTAHARERMVLGRVVKPLPPPPLSDLPLPKPLTAATYAEIAEKMLFSKDRNSIVVQTVAAEKPMPSLPLLHGVVDVGDGPVAILALKAGTQDKGFRPGEKVGEFKLVSVSAQEIVFDWEGKRVTKKPEDIMDKTIPQAAAPPAAAAHPPAAPPPPPPTAGKAAPGASMGADKKACQAGDTSPAGTVADGMRKVLTATPFGNTCYWEPTK